MPEWADTLIRIAAAVAVGLILTQVALVVIRRSMRRIESRQGVTTNLKRRSRTLASVLRSAVLVVIWTIVVITVLGEVGIAVGPMLAAAGVVGLALGFGAQNMVRDLLAGFFILLEGQYDVGDVVEAAGVIGAVEGVNLRTTILRGLDGQRHVVPNGEIRVSSNHTKVFSRYLMTVRVPLDEDADRVVATLRAVADRMRREVPYRDMMTAPITVLGVDDFGDFSVDVLAYLETSPGSQWDVGRELRRRLKHALDEEGISIAYPRQDVILRRAAPAATGGDGDAPAGEGSASREGEPASDV